MQDKIFFDSNVLIYYATEPSRKVMVAKLMAESYEVFISLQCLNEFTNVCLKRKLLDDEAIKASIQEFRTFFDVWKSGEETILKAMDIHSRYQYSYYDSLIIATAIECCCEVLYSEDMQDGHIIEGVKIVNPFRK